MDPEYYDFEDRTYINPMLSRDEQMGFVNTLRDTVGRNTAQINAQTRALGSNLPSTQGGLTGSNGYFAQRYQTTPLETQANTLKATAQAKALNDLLNNYQAQVANRYNQAYRKASARGSSGGRGLEDILGDYLFTDKEPDGTFDSEGGKSEEEIEKEKTIKAAQNNSSAAMAGLLGTILGFGLPTGILGYLMAREQQKNGGQ